MTIFRGHLLIICFTLIHFLACQPTAEEEGKTDKLLAQVFNKSLFESELEGMILPETSDQDSALIVNSYVERWVRDNLLMHQAERHISKDLKIDELVRDYRASLILHNYEKTLVELELDSTISQAELLQHYEENKDQYQLKQPILRCYFIKLQSNAPELDQVRSWWRNESEENHKKLIEYCSANAVVYMLNDSTWYDKEDIYRQMPDKMAKDSKFKVQEKINGRDDQHFYFLHILETKNQRNIAPLAYISSQISRVILHHKKIKLLEDKREEMYEREFGKSNIKIYTQ